jgi:hypothetical protein
MTAFLPVSFHHASNALTASQSVSFHASLQYNCSDTLLLLLLTPTLKMKGVHSSQILVPIYTTTLHHIPGYCNPTAENMLCNDETTAYIMIPN